jgi:hypothetical protein
MLFFGARIDKGKNKLIQNEFACIKQIKPKNPREIFYL